MCCNNNDSSWLWIILVLIVVPVSYTHLDVYKRQIYTRGENLSTPPNKLRAGSQMGPFMAVIEKTDVLDVRSFCEMHCIFARISVQSAQSVEN